MFLIVERPSPASLVHADGHLAIRTAHRRLIGCEIFGPAQAAVVTGPHLNADALVVDVTLDTGCRMEHDALAADGADDLAENDYLVIGNDSAVDVARLADN